MQLGKTRHPVCGFSEKSSLCQSLSNYTRSFILTTWCLIFFSSIGLSNGALAQIIKVNKRNDLQYDALLSSDVIERYKPNAKMYETAIMALKATENPGELAMVAAHAYDLQAAAK